MDFWPEDSHIIGIASPGGLEPCVCLLTAGKQAGHYDVEYGDTVARDCLYAGVEWIVRHELRARRGGR